MMNFLQKLKDEVAFIKGNYLILVVTWLLMDFFREIPASFYGLYVIELGGTALIIGMIGFASKICYASVQFPGGYIADKYGRRLLLISTPFVKGFIYLLFAFAPNWKLILVGEMLYGIFRISNPSLHALTAESIPPEKRGVGYSIYQLTIDVTSTPAPLLAGLLFYKFGFVLGMRIAYVFVSIAYILTSIIRFKLKETIESAEEINIKEIIMAFPISIKESINVLFKVPKSLLYFIVSRNVFTLAASMFFPYIIIYVTEEIGLSKFQWSIIMSMQFLITTILIIPFGKMIDKYGRKRLILIFNILLSFILISITYGNFYVLLLVMPLLGISFSVSGSASKSLVADLTPKKVRGRILGLIRFIGLIIGATGNLLGGFIYQTMPHKNIFLIPIFLITSGIIVFFLFVNEPEIKEI